MPATGGWKKKDFLLLKILYTHTTTNIIINIIETTMSYLPKIRYRKMLQGGCWKKKKSDVRFPPLSSQFFSEQEKECCCCTVLGTKNGFVSLLNTLLRSKAAGAKRQLLRFLCSVLARQKIGRFITFFVSQSHGKATNKIFTRRSEQILTKGKSRTFLTKHGIENEEDETKTNQGINVENSKTTGLMPAPIRRAQHLTLKLRIWLYY